MYQMNVDLEFDNLKARMFVQFLFSITALQI